MEGEESFSWQCMDLNDAFALPHKWITTQKQFLNMTERGDRTYWHILLATLDDNGIAINLAKKKREKVPGFPKFGIILRARQTRER